VDTRTGEPLFTRVREDWVDGLAFSRAGELLTFNDYQGAAVWDGRTGEPIREVDMGFGPDVGLRATAFGRSGRVLAGQIHAAGGVGDDVLEIWDLVAGERRHALTLGADEDIEALEFAWDDALLVTGTEAGVVTGWDVETGTPLTTFHTGDRLAGLAVLLDPASGEERLLVTMSYDPREGILRVWDLFTGERVRELRSSFPCSALAVFADGSRIVAGHFDGGLSLLDPVRGEIFRMPGHTLPVMRVAVSADGLRIASVDVDGWYRLWDTVHPRARANARRATLERRRLEAVVRPRVEALFDRLALASRVAMTERRDTLAPSRELATLQAWRPRSPSSTGTRARSTTTSSSRRTRTSRAPSSRRCWLATGGRERAVRRACSSPPAAPAAWSPSWPAAATA
jgi:WD40 repeat protein